MDKTERINDYLKSTKKLRVRLDFMEPIMGMLPANEQLYQDYIASKAEDASTIEEEVAALGADEVMEKKMTIFPKMEDGRPFFWDYQIKGFFKDACGGLRKIKGYESSKMKAYKKEIDTSIFVLERRVIINYDGEIGVCERPLRASTPMGERISLAASEEIQAPASCEFTIILLNPDHEKVVREWLDYGMLRGMGQWRNSGKGRFVWTEV